MGDNGRSAVDSLIRCLVCHDFVCEPLTLPCLHSCCKACVGAIAVVPYASDGSNDCESTVSQLVTCPQCGVTVSAANLRPNALIAACAEHARATDDEAFSCTICLNEHGVVSQAEYECAQCDGRLCSGCLRWHNKFKRGHSVVPLAAATRGRTREGSNHRRDRLQPASATSAVRCSAHDRPCDSFCFTCGRLACDDCVGSGGECERALHDVTTLASQRTDDYVERVKRNVDATLGHVDRNLLAAQGLYGDDGGLEALRQADLRRLLAHKRAALDCVGRAYERAEQLVCDAYVDLACKAPERRRAAAHLSEQLRHVRCYAELLLDTKKQSVVSEGGGGGHAFVLDQHALVLSCVRTLLHGVNEIASAGIVAFAADVVVGDGGSSNGGEADAEVERLLHGWLPDLAVAGPTAEGERAELLQDSQQQQQQQVEFKHGADRQQVTPTAEASGQSTLGQRCLEAQAGAALIIQPRVTSAAGSGQPTRAAAAGAEAPEQRHDAAHVPPPLSGAATEGEPDQQPLLRCCCCTQLVDDPVLLGCLHNCCKRCMDSIASPDGDISSSGIVGISPGGGGGRLGSVRRVTCPLCGIACDVIGLKDNSFVAALVHAKRNSSGPLLCDPCQENYDKIEATGTCGDCSKRFCDECLVWHNKFSGDHALVPTTAASLVLPSCAEHSSKYDIYCIGCDSLRCMACSKPCMDRNHDITVVNGQRTKELVRDISSRVHATLDVIGERAAAALAGIGAREHRLEAAREADNRRLRESTRSLLDTVGLLLRGAETDVAAVYESLMRDLPKLKAGAQRLAVRTRTAESYCRLLLSSASSASVLDQQRPVEACLESLRAELDVLPSLARTEEFVVVTDGRRRDDVLEDIVRDWVGCPKPSCPGKDLKTMPGNLAEPPAAHRPHDHTTADTAVGADARTHAPHHGMIGATHSSATHNEIDETLSDNFILNDIAIDGMESQQFRSSSFGKPTCTFNAGDDCRDLAFTPDGHILLAALKKGMKEYDTLAVPDSLTPGHCPTELSRWRPPPTEEGGDDCVSTVHAFDDGLVAVGLINSQSVALLRRNAPAAKDPWLEEQRFMLRTGPWRLAGLGDLLAVSGARDVATKKSRHWSPGPFIDLMRIGDGQQLLSVTLEYDVQSVALTARAIVVLSNDVQQLTATGTRSYVVDAYSHSGERLWRSDSGNACDVCAAWPHEGAGVLYLAQLHNDRVRAVSHTDGRYLDDAVSSHSHGLRSPICVSLRATAGTPPAALAVLSAGDEVNVYPVSNAH